MCGNQPLPALFLAVLSHHFILLRSSDYSMVFHFTIAGKVLWEQIQAVLFLKKKDTGIKDMLQNSTFLTNTRSFVCVNCKEIKTINQQTLITNLPHARHYAKYRVEGLINCSATLWQLIQEGSNPTNTSHRLQQTLLNYLSKYRILLISKVTSECFWTFKIIVRHKRYLHWWSRW